MIKCYYGDVEVVNFEMSLLEKLYEGRIVRTIYNPESWDEVVSSFISRDIFSSELNFDALFIVITDTVKIKDKNILEKILHFKGDVLIFFCNGANTIKSNAVYKAFGPDKFVPCSPVRSDFGELDIKQIRSMKDKILSLPQYSGVFDKDLVEWMIENTHVGGIFKDLDTLFLIAVTFGITDIEELRSVTSVTNKTYLLSIMKFLQTRDWEGLFLFLKGEDTLYMSVLSTLRTIFFNYSKIYNSFRDEDYQIDLNTVSSKTGIKQWYVVKSEQYLRHLGPKKVDTIYRYISKAMALEIYDPLPFSEDVKKRDLAFLLMGEEPLLKKI